ncbi:MAG: hypothetical protein U0169_26175 [Polyangiaceae bacterium]
MISRVPPTREHPEFEHPEELAWASRESSPISSRNNVPPFAASNTPTFAFTAPVNAPFSWPNSSDSRSVSAHAAQLTATYGPFARADA